MIWNRVGVLTDEVSPHLEEALDWIVNNQLKHVEIRSVDGRNIMNISDEALVNIRHEVERRGLFVSAIASPVFKCSLDPERQVSTGDTFGQQEEDIEEHHRKLLQAIRIAKQLGTTKIRIFSFWREQDPLRYEADIVLHLKRAAAIAEQENVTLLLENEPSCNGGYAEEVGRLVRGVNSRALQVLWDPGNEAYGGKSAYPEGYESIKDVSGHVHLKDALVEQDGTPRCVPIGNGRVPFAEQIIALEKDGYKGLYTIETHYIPDGGTPADGTMLTLQGLSKVLSSLETQL
ncbi:sugar phosphate isomerase/epimerase family protein [Paenibacillus agricola]|uniref:Sugar phosphate isomerase/epimerase n=1 Tax=Paenibacillus agricola TaxID=2716264 RepID=A0ABX0J772_9BACL|nr:sugar phosphate isomerase/epimerase family protein [Paenibacillus agricola]NHN31641.1 sugar phosphate isomerase/epimerase [Paenibacillus agricola]